MNFKRLKPLNALKPSGRGFFLVNKALNIYCSLLLCFFILYFHYTASDNSLKSQVFLCVLSLNVLKIHLHYLNIQNTDKYTVAPVMAKRHPMICAILFVIHI